MTSSSSFHDTGMNEDDHLENVTALSLPDVSTSQGSIRSTDSVRPRPKSVLENLMAGQDQMKASMPPASRKCYFTDIFLESDVAETSQSHTGRKVNKIRHSSPQRTFRHFTAVFRELEDAEKLTACFDNISQSHTGDQVKKMKHSPTQGTSRHFTDVFHEFEDAEKLTVCFDTRPQSLTGGPVKKMKHSSPQRTSPHFTDVVREFGMTVRSQSPNGREVKKMEQASSEEQSCHCTDIFLELKMPEIS